MTPRQPTLAFEAIAAPVRLPTPSAPVPAMPLLPKRELHREVAFPFGAVLAGLPRVLRVVVRVYDRGLTTLVLTDSRTHAGVGLEELSEGDLGELGRAVANRLRAVEEAS